jgi:hypothetical protein
MTKGILYGGGSTLRLPRTTPNPPLPRTVKFPPYCRSRDVRTCVENFKARNKSEGPAILEPIASRKLRRLSTVGSKTRRRPLESSPAAFFFSESRVYCKLINMGGENVTVRERSFHIEVEHETSFMFDVLDSS